MNKQSKLFLGVLATALVIAGIAVGRAKTQAVTSGVKVGGTLGSFRPRHVTGADRGKDVCPLCQYPSNPAVQVWIKGDAESNVASIAALLEKCAVTHQARKLKAFLVYYDVSYQDDAAVRRRLEEFAARNSLKNAAFVLVYSTDTNAIRDNEINADPSVKNTVFVYKDSKVSAKFVNLAADARGLSSLEAAISRMLPEQK